MSMTNYLGGQAIPLSRERDLGLVDIDAPSRRAGGLSADRHQKKFHVAKGFGQRKRSRVGRKKIAVLRPFSLRAIVTLIWGERGMCSLWFVPRRVHSPPFSTCTAVLS